MKKLKGSRRPAERPKRFRIPAEWKGETAVIFGGGPSLTSDQVTAAVDRGWRRIATNNAYRLDTNADVLVWGDQPWYFWNRKDLARHTGAYKLTWKYVPPTRGFRFHVLRQGRSSAPISEDPGTVTATNTGQGAMNVAYHFGASRIVLLGFDMGPGKKNGNVIHNWHNLHRRSPSPTRYQEVFAPSIRAAAAWLGKRGVEVVNCTPASQLTGVEIRPLTEVA